MRKISEINRHEIWPAVISAAASIGGGLLASNAAGDAAKYQKNAAKIAAKLQREMYYQSREDLAPWRTAGTQALNVLRQKLGMGYYAPDGDPASSAIPFGSENQQTQMRKVPIYENREVPNPDYEFGGWDRGQSAFITKRVLVGYKEVPVNQATVNQATEAPAGMKYVEGTGEGPPGYEPIPEFTESPGYQWTLEQGINAGRNALSAMGRSRSGAHVKAATEYAEGLASTEYDNFLNRWYRDQAEKRNAFASQINPYLAISGMGQTATENTAQLGAGAAGRMGQAAMYGGQAQATGAINQANALTGAISGGANALLYYNALRNLQPQAQYTQPANRLGLASSYGNLNFLTG